jgi:hypothetical protein
MNIACIIFITLCFVACKSNESAPSSVDFIVGTANQNSLFQDLLIVTDNKIPEQQLNDSLAFLVLPVQASCPSCRKKTIDSILKYQDRMPHNRFVIISAKAGIKKISSYFREEHAELPVLDNRLFLDTNNQAGKLKLYDEKPTMYYTHNQKVYKRVGAVPMTVKQDLQEFFSGYRTDKN